MAGAIVDPEELRKFSYHLQKISMDLRGLKDSTRVKMNHLNQTWKDQENAKFVQQFEQDMKLLDKLMHTAEEYSAFLKRKASSLDPYFNTKK